MARKHSVSPNQTALRTYQALAPEWGSPALSVSRGTNEGRIRANVTPAQSPAGRSTSVLVCQYYRPQLGHLGRRRSVRHHARKGSGVDHLV